MGIVSGLDELNVHPNGVATLLYASFQNVGYAKLLCDLAEIGRFGLDIAAWKCARLLLDQRSWISGSESRPECYRQSTHSLCLRCDFQTAALRCFSLARHSKRIFDSRSMCEEKCRHAENDDGCDCESGARASHAAYLRGATLQARC